MIRNTLLFAIAVGLAISLYYMPDRKSPDTDTEEKYQEVFDSQLWRGGTERQKGAMVEYILKSDTLRGLQDIEIMQLLGRADDIHKNTFYYNVDLGRSKRTNGTPAIYQLMINFDTTGRAIKVDLSG